MTEVIEFLAGRQTTLSEVLLTQAFKISGDITVLLAFHGACLNFELSPL